jgi:hypothetical protein
MTRKIKSVKYGLLPGECTEDTFKILWYFFNDIEQLIISENFILAINESEKDLPNKTFDIEFVGDSKLKLELYDYIRDAERQGKWIQSNYDRGIIFTPQQLRDNIDRGQFVWGLVNWDLIDPLTHLNEQIDIILKKCSELKTLTKFIR